MKRFWQISLFVLVGLVAALFLYLRFGQTARAPSLLLRSVRSPIYIDESFGAALLTLTNGSGHDVFFQIGGPPILDLIWFAVERKRGDAWVVESESKEWAPSDMNIAAGLNHWPKDKARDFRVPLAADGQIRRIVVRWKPTPRRVPPMLRRLQSLWWKRVALQRFSFVELRSPEVIAMPGAPRFDFEAATNRLHANDYNTNRIVETNRLFNGFGLGYSLDRKLSGTTK